MNPYARPLRVARDITSDYCTQDVPTRESFLILGPRPNLLEPRGVTLSAERRAETNTGKKRSTAAIRETVRIPHRLNDNTSGPVEMTQLQVSLLRWLA